VPDTFDNYFSNPASLDSTPLSKAIRRTRALAGPFSAPMDASPWERAVLDAIHSLEQRLITAGF
jgi:hypothetical protein